MVRTPVRTLSGRLAGLLILGGVVLFILGGVVPFASDIEWSILLKWNSHPKNEKDLFVPIEPG